LVLLSVILMAISYIGPQKVVRVLSVRDMMFTYAYQSDSDTGTFRQTTGMLSVCLGILSDDFYNSCMTVLYGKGLSNDRVL
jgi:hypothetical protein